jgi:hypothetical protein
MISDNEVERSVIVVRNASVREVNGEYHFSRFNNEAGEFTRRGIVNGTEYLFTILKFGSLQGNYFWYLVLGPVGQEVDFTQPYTYEFMYYSATSNGRLPPKKLSRMYNEVDPGLTLEVYASDNAISDDESDLQNFRKPDSFTAFYLDDSLKDFTIVYGTGSFKVHKCFLSPISLYFKRIFSGQWKESNSCSLETLPTVTAADFNDFLRYLYLKKLQSKRPWAVWYLCDYFEVLDSIKEEIAGILMKTLTVTNARKFIPMINRMIVADTGENSFPRKTQQNFVRFIINNSEPLADDDFPFCELEQPILKAVFKDISMKR